MPVIHVEALAQPPDVDLDAALSAVCRNVAELLGGDPRGTWCTWRTLERYVEDDDGPATQPRDTHPPLVRVVAFEGKDTEVVASILRCVADTLADQLGLGAGNVFVTYEEARRGRLYTGGGVVA